MPTRELLDVVRDLYTNMVVIIEVFDELYKAMPPKKKAEFIGYANDIFLFLEAYKHKYPSEKD